MKDVLQKDQNCWRIERADKVAFVVDGENYFPAVRQAILKARHSIFLVGWDIHSAVELDRSDGAGDAPNTLGDLLDYCAGRNPGLRIYVLNWDFAMIYTLEREFFPQYKLQWKSHPRVEFCLDGNHPTGASQHQKLVVLDDCVAFSGGFDLAQWRWDSRQHEPEEPRRRDPIGRSYQSFHDVQIAVSGPAARAVGELARARWYGAEGCEPATAATTDEVDCWPEELAPAMTDVDVAFALTRPEWNGQRELRQVEALFLDSIAAAERFIYIENQYFTSHVIGEALEASLKRKDGPEIIMVLPDESRGWLEQHTMDVLRCRLLRRLRAADCHNRLRVYYPRLKNGDSLLVHAKVMIVDDNFLRIGSANLSNRSMGLDTECDAAILTVQDTEPSEAVADFRRDLMAEHLGRSKADMAAAEGRHGSLIDAVESLREGKRTLTPITREVPEKLDRMVPDSAVIDPEKPIDPQALFRYIVRGSEKRGLTQYFRLAALIAGILALAALWRWTPLSELLNISSIEAAAEWIERSPMTPPLVFFAFVIGSIAAVPLTLMIIGTIAVFGPLSGFLYSLSAAEVAAIVTFLIGRKLGGGVKHRLAGSRLNVIKRKLTRPGLLGIMVLRVVPVAPFTVINVAAGASNISLRDFAIGSFLGMLPAIAALAFLADRITAAFAVPDAGSVISLVLGALLVVAAMWALHAWAKKRQRARG